MGSGGCEWTYFLPGGREEGPSLAGAVMSAEAAVENCSGRTADGACSPPTDESEMK